MEATETLYTTDAASMGQAVVDSIRDNRLDDAETLLQQLNETYPQTRNLLVFPVMIAIQRGRVAEAWQLINGLPEDQSPELKALCLRLLKDPSWHGYAEASANHPDPYVRKAMRNLLGRSEDEDIHDLLR
jgi:type III secretion protein HrpB1